MVCRFSHLKFVEAATHAPYSGHSESLGSLFGKEEYYGQHIGNLQAQPPALAVVP